MITTATMGAAQKPPGKKSVISCYVAAVCQASVVAAPLLVQVDQLESTNASWRSKICFW